MTSSNRQLLRVSLKAALIIFLPLTGFVWAMPAMGSFGTVAVVLTLLSIVVGVGAEFMASTTEVELKTLSEQVATDRRTRAEALSQRDEKLRQFDRVVHLLTEQNHSLRAKLLAAHSDLQRRREEEAGAAVSADLMPQRRGGFATRAG